MNIAFHIRRCVKPMQSTGAVVILAIVVLSMGMGGCAFLGMAAENSMGVAVKPQYRGLKKQSVAIVVYEDASTMFMYPQAQQEVSAFVSATPNCRTMAFQIAASHRRPAVAKRDPCW